jgi:hypothetical protein
MLEVYVTSEGNGLYAHVNGPPVLFVCEKYHADGAVRPDRSFWLDFRLDFPSKSNLNVFLKDFVIGSYVKPMRVYTGNASGFILEAIGDCWYFREAAVIGQGDHWVLLRPFSVQYIEGQKSTVN